MTEKKIATAIDILINVDRFEHIQITKYGETKIEYSSEEERKQKEDQLSKETIDDIKRSLNLIVEGLKNKGAQPVEAIKEKIVTKMPTWLEKGVEPNIANLAQKTYEKNKTNIEANNEKIKKDQAEASQEISEIFEEKDEKPVKEDKKEEVKEEIKSEDVFGDFKEEDLFK
jgi:anti-sigma28 factor (negative regulator of flagellin synthesis)